MKIVTYNVNGIRAALKKGLLDWIDEEAPDIFCVQETKAQSDQVDFSPFHDRGYHVYWHQAEKKGYSGVAIFSKIEADAVTYGCNVKDYDTEGRIIRVDYKDFSLLNVYIPSGTSGEIRQAYKMVWLEDFKNYILEIRKAKPNLLICGDVNIAHHPIDIHDPIGNKKSSGFLPEEREWLTEFLETGMLDVFRHFNKEPHQYSWWTYRQNARMNNKGWRIDYFFATLGMKEYITNALILPEARHSDHCPVCIKIDFN